MASIKSQLEGKTVNAPKVVNPQSQFGQFVLGDMKGGNAAHEFRMSMVIAAIREALKGNSRALLEARDIATGKSKKALSYFDGFAAIGIPARVAYTGKLSDAANKAIVEQIDATTLALAETFEVAFLTRFHAPAEPKAAKPKAKDTPVSDEIADLTGEVRTLKAENKALKAAAAKPVELSVADIIGAAINAVSTGAATAAEVDELLGAITLARMAQAQPEPLAA